MPWHRRRVRTLRTSRTPWGASVISYIEPAVMSDRDDPIKRRTISGMMRDQSAPTTKIARIALTSAEAPRPDPRLERLRELLASVDAWFGMAAKELISGDLRCCRSALGFAVVVLDSAITLQSELEGK